MLELTRVEKKRDYSCVSRSFDGTYREVGWSIKIGVHPDHDAMVRADLRARVCDRYSQTELTFLRGD